MSKKNEHNNFDPLSVLFMSGWILIGVGFDFFFGTMPAGTVLGCGIGLVLTYLINQKNK